MHSRPVGFCEAEQSSGQHANFRPTFAGELRPLSQRTYPVHGRLLRTISAVASSEEGGLGGPDGVVGLEEVVDMSHLDQRPCLIVERGEQDFPV